MLLRSHQIKDTHPEKLDPRVKRTRDLLKQALIDLLGEKEFSAITVHDIADKATVNRATFYAHFEDKYALLNQMIHERFQTILEAKLLTTPRLSESSLRLLMQASCEFLAQFANHCKPRSCHHSEPPIEMHLQQLLFSIVLNWIEPEPPHGQVDYTGPASAAATVISWGMFGAVFQWAHGGQKIPAEVLINQTMPLITPGIQALFVSSSSVSTR